MPRPQQDVMLGRPQCQHIGIGNLRVAHPQKHAGFGFGEQLKAQFKKTGGDFFMRGGEALAQRFGVFAPAPVNQGTVNDALRQLGRGQAGNHFELGQVLDQLWVARHIAHAQVG